MSKFRKGRLASAMLCTLLFGGNASAMQKDVSKGISKKDNLSKGQTKDKESENRKPDDSSNPLLKYVLYVLGFGKLADEGVGIAEAKDYIDYYKSQKLSPLGKLSLYKFAMAKYYKTKTIGTMRNLVAESYKNAEGIKQVFDGITGFLIQYEFEGKDGIFNVTCSDDSFDIKAICDSIEANFDFGSLSNYVKAVLGVSVEQCDKILVNLNQNNKYIAFVKDNVCLNLTKYRGEFRFMLCTVKNNSPENCGYLLCLDNCYVAKRYLLHILGMEDKSTYSFYDRIFGRVYGEFYRCQNEADKVFPELFKKELKLIKE